MAPEGPSASAPGPMPGGAGQVVDMAIAGGGLAGSAAAAVLARRGFNVVIIDPHPVYPPDLRCEKLDGSQVRTLQHAGLADLVLPAAAPYGEFWIARFGRVIEKRVEAQYGILYDALVNRMRGAIPPGTRFIVGKVTSIVNGQDRQMLTLSTGERFSARLVVLASGLSNVLRNALAIVRQEVSKCHCVTLAFDVTRQGGAAFPFPALTYHGERPVDRVAYVTVFPVPGAMRANLMVYRAASDPWLREMRDRPASTLHRILPGLAKVTGQLDVVSTIAVRPVDLYVSRSYLLPGVVLIGDAFATSCPAAGTGTGKVFTDVDRLCNVHVPGWMQTAGMGTDKLSAFYRDPVKVACDLQSSRKAFTLRSDCVGQGLVPQARRWGQFLKGLAGCGRMELLPRMGREGVASPQACARVEDGP